MAEKLAITALDDSEATQDNCSSCSEIISLDLDILGEPMHFRIGVIGKYARLADIVPMARKLSSELTLAVFNHHRKDGNFIPCRKACSACCSYLVPLSVPEVFRLWQELLEMSQEHRAAILKSCLGTAKVILDNVPEHFEIDDSIEIDSQIHTGRLGKWYLGLKQPCPFLSDSLCTIYEQRPIACREHMVTDSEIFCEAEWIDQSHVIRMPLRVVECLGRLAAELEQTTVEAVMLPLALPWAQENVARNNRQWPAKIMVERFVEIIKATALKSDIADAAFNEHPALVC